MLLSANKVDVTDYTRYTSETNERLTTQLLKIEKNINQISTMENFIDKYSPIRVQSQISEVLHDMTQHAPQLRDLFVESEKRKFNELHQALLVDNGVGQLLLEMKRVNKELGLLSEDSSGSSGDEQDPSIDNQTSPNIAVDIHKRSSKTLQKGEKEPKKEEKRRMTIN